MLIKGKPAFVYDIEVFPNFFSVAVKNTESGNIRTFQISVWQNDIVVIVELFLNQNIYWVGYNSIHYDAPIISYIILNYKRLSSQPVWLTNQELKRFSDLIIESKTSASWKKYKYANLFSNLDLLTMMFAEKLRVSLKALQVTMEYRNVEEYDGNFNEFLPQSDVQKLINYNINDILSTEELLNRLKGEIELRLGIESSLGVNVLNQDGVNLGVEVIKNSYLKDTGKSWYEIKDLRSPCHEVDLKDIYFDFINFKTPLFQEFYKELYNTHINLDAEKLKKTADRWKKTLRVNDLEITYSLGGIHTKNKPEIYKTDENWIVIDSDCASMYPSAIINFGLYPQHLGPEFLRTYKKIREDRIKAKHNGDKIMNQTYKLALNGISGMLQNEYSWCYDPKTVIRLRLNCQAMLLMLTERLIMLGCRIGQLNTDGALYLAPKNKFDDVMQTCKEWEKETQFQLEHEYFEVFYQYAVNDYIGDNLKEKEIKNYYEDKIFGDMAASHILISVDVKDDAKDEEIKKAEEKAKSKAQKIIKELNDGKKFADLAKKYSDDDATKNKGGDLGTFKYNDMVTEFSAACKDLEVNEYTKEPVKTQYGYHIILKTKQEKKAKLKDVKDEIKETLTSNKLNNDKTLFYKTLMNIRNDKKIRWNDSVLEKAYNEYMDSLIEQANTSTTTQQ